MATIRSSPDRPRRDVSETVPQQRPCEPFLAGVEEVIDEVFFDADVSRTRITLSEDDRRPSIGDDLPRRAGRIQKPLRIERAGSRFRRVHGAICTLIMARKRGCPMTRFEARRTGPKAGVGSKPTDDSSKKSLSGRSRCVRFEFSPRRTRTRHPAIHQARVHPIRLQTEKIRVHERVEHHPAHRPLDPTQALHLFGPQPQAWHFQILSANTFQQL